MRVLQVHNVYQQPGGEDAVVAAERALLEEYGHETTLFAASNDPIRGLWSRVITAWHAPYSRRARDALAQRLIADRPDIVHVHNFFPLLTPSIYDACRAAGVPVVQTLHNYRLVCPVAILLREGKPCELCVTGSAYQSVIHGCYRESRLGTFAVARMIEKHRKWDTWRTKVDRFIALTDFAKGKFILGGLPADRIVVKPNFVADDLVADMGEADRTPPHERTQSALFVGRLSAEKGLSVLLEAWREIDFPLRLAGDGPLLDTVRHDAPAAVTVLGRLDGADVAAEMRRAAFLVMPSECYEGFPMVLVEAFARGLPVVASRLGSLAEIVEDGVTGMHFRAGDARDLAGKIRHAIEHPSETRRMGEAARRTYERRYTPEANYHALVAIYRDAMATARGAGAGKAGAGDPADDA